MFLNKTILLCNMMLTAEEETDIFSEFPDLMAMYLKFAFLAAMLLCIPVFIRMAGAMIINNCKESSYSSTTNDSKIAVKNATKKIEEKPAEEPEPIKTPIKIKTYPYVCSYCNSGFTVPQAHGKCPNCGANMNN